MRIAVALILVAGCQRHAGEVHIHQYAGGAHPAALFVDEPVRLRGLTDTILADQEASATAGPCSLFERDRLLKRPNPIDIGVVRVLGGSLTSEVALHFQSVSVGYVSDSRRPVFTGGEVLKYEGDHFSGTLRAPMPLELLAPAEGFSSSNLAIRWRPGESSRVHVTLVASRRDGPYALIRCAVPDRSGALDLPAMLVNRLPPPPRDLQLEVRRDMIGSTDGAGGAIILHASIAASRSGAD